MILDFRIWYRKAAVFMCACSNIYIFCPITLFSGQLTSINYKTKDFTKDSKLSAKREITPGLGGDHEYTM